MKKDPIINDFVSLRACVGFLGQADKWWNCLFLGKTGPRILQAIFPRTAHQAAMRSVIQAASLHHDKSLGQRSVNHLFRLPLPVEERVGQVLDSFSEQNWSTMTFENKEEALVKLKGLCPSGITVTPGPVQIGTVSRIISRGAINELAMHYHAAFTQGVQCLPYFGEKIYVR